MGAAKKPKRRNAPSAGGAASARGNVYQQKTAAWWLTRVLTQNTAIGAAFGLTEGVLPVRIFGQTEYPVDDVRVEFSDDARFFLQCKRSVSISQTPTSEFGKAWMQFCQQVKRAKNSALPVRCILCFEEPNTALIKLHEVFRRARQESNWTKLTSYESYIGNPNVVLYQDEYPVADMFGDDFYGDEDLVADTIYTKSRIWEYEKEWRIFESGKPPGIRVIDPRCVTGIILGCEASQRTQSELIDLVKRRKHRLKLYRAVPKGDAYALSIVPL